MIKNSSISLFRPGNFRYYYLAMDYFELIEKRASIRSYLKREIEEEKLQKILKAANSAPSAGNLQGYEMVVVQDERKRRNLAKAAYGQSFVHQAPVNLVFLQDPQRSGRKYKTRGRELYSLQDATIAATFAHLASFDLGLGSCWVGAFDEAGVKEVLETELRPVVLIVIGYPKSKGGRTGRRKLEDLVSWL